MLVNAATHQENLCGFKGLFMHNVFQPVSVIIFIVIRIMDRMGPSPILSVIHTVTIVTMLNNNGGNNGPGLKMLHVNRFLTF